MERHECYGKRLCTSGFERNRNLTYTLDGGPSQNYVNQNPLTLTEEGQHTMVFQVEDTAGNTFTATLAVNIDLTAPSVGFGTNGNESWSQSASTTVTVTDAESGVDDSSLQYAWTTDTATPSTGWTSFEAEVRCRRTESPGTGICTSGRRMEQAIRRMRCRTASACAAGSTGSTSTESDSYVPDMKTVIDLNGGSPEPTVDVFNSSIVNETNLIKTIESKVAEAKEANAAIDFADTQGHWAEKTIDIFIKLQLINGYEDGTFRPNNPITRAEFAAILNRVFNIQGGSNTSVVLKDIGDNWAKEAIENLVAAGVIYGYADGTFKPNQTITREEMVVMLSRIVNLNSLEKDPTKGNFNDLDDAYAAGGDPSGSAGEYR